MQLISTQRKTVNDYDALTFFFHFTSFHFLSVAIFFQKKKTFVVVQDCCMENEANVIKISEKRVKTIRKRKKNEKKNTKYRKKWKQTLISHPWLLIKFGRKISVVPFLYSANIKKNSENLLKMSFAFSHHHILVINITFMFSHHPLSIQFTTSYIFKYDY